MATKKVIQKLLLFQLIVCVVFVLILTVYKFIFISDFTKIAELYENYAKYDADVSLVYEGE